MRDWKDISNVIMLKCPASVLPLSTYVHGNSLLQLSLESSSFFYPFQKYMSFLSAQVKSCKKWCPYNCTDTTGDSSPFPWNEMFTIHLRKFNFPQSYIHFKLLCMILHISYAWMCSYWYSSLFSSCYIGNTHFICVCSLSLSQVSSIKLLFLVECCWSRPHSHSSL